MSKLGLPISLVIVVLFCITEHEAVAPLFLQAITSAMATIPLTGGPMTTGLVGAKLGIGTKLLYYLGFFGRRSKPVAKKSAPLKPVGKGAGNIQAVPLPYVLSGGGGFQQMGGGGFQQMEGGFGGPFGEEGFQQMGGGFEGPMMGGGGFQDQFGGIDPSQIFAALRAQGYDPNTAMQLMNYGGGGNFEMGGGNFMGGGGFGMPQNFPPGPFPSPVKPAPAREFIPIPGQNIPGFQEDSFTDQPLNNDDPQDQGDESNDIESFFTFLQDMDENFCISRLVCDIGSDPSFLGEFSENIHSIVGSLDVQPTSGAYPYVEIMETGRKEGGCDSRFPQCSDSAYEIVKNVAPSVGVPQNINPATVDQL